MMDRRHFLTGTALGLAGLTGAAALSACTASAPAPAADNADKTATGPSDEARAASIVEREADVAAKATDTRECDIVILGSGAGGLGAAVKAAQLGAHVILLEKGGELGGSTSGTEGMFGWGSTLQHETNVEMPLVAELIEEELVYSNYRIDAALWKRFINASGKSVDWLRELGYQFDRVDVYKGQISAFKCYHWWAEEKGATMIAALADKARELGVEIITQAPGVALMTDAGKVRGVYAHNLADNSYFAVEAAATIVGTGGFGLNNALIESLTAWDMTFGTTRSTGTGDGVIMAEDVGAGTYMTSILPRTAVEGYTVYDEIAIGCCDNPLLFLNENGDRFMNEGTYVTSYMALYVNSIISQKKAYTVFDQAMVDRFMTGEGILSGWRKYKAGANLPEFQAQLDECVASGRGNVFKADTIEALAEAMGVDAQNMKANVDRYNALCAGGLDEDYLKGPEFLIPVQTGPFYAVRQDPSVTNTIGGLDVNYDNAVVNIDGDVIEGLYCVGVDACKLYKETYNYAMSGGLVSYCLYSGLNAAEHAVTTYLG
ncbi:MAG: FAD-dependent oxidoreductase [Adlercreutzia mucosicola]|nr:FAD-dependent oxidoreductase [Adlercreutzia mucosicola]